MDEILGTIKQFVFNFEIEGWELCHGQSLPVQQNTALYSLMTNTYGGDQRNFNLPDLRKKKPSIYKVGDIMEDGLPYVETYYKAGEIMENGLPYIESFICTEGLYPARK